MLNSHKWLTYPDFLCLTSSNLKSPPPHSLPFRWETFNSLPFTQQLLYFIDYPQFCIITDWASLHCVAVLQMQKLHCGIVRYQFLKFQTLDLLQDFFFYRESQYRKCPAIKSFCGSVTVCRSNFGTLVDLLTPFLCTCPTNRCKVFYFTWQNKEWWCIQPLTKDMGSKVAYYKNVHPCVLDYKSGLGSILILRPVSKPQFTH